MEETQRQNLVMAFSNVLRTSALVGVVDLQRTALAFSALVERTPNGTMLPLAPLYDFLIEQKAPEGPVREVLVFLKSREGRFGVKMELPPKLATLSEEERNKLIIAFTQRGASSGTHSGSTNPGRGIEPQKPVKQAVVITGASGEPELADHPALAPTPTPTPPPKKQEAFVPDQSGPGMSGSKKLGIVLGLLTVLFVVDLVVSRVTADPPPAVITFDDPAGLPCVQTQGSKDVVICRVPQAFADKTPKPVVDAKGAVTAAAARGLGYQRVLVFSIEDSTMRWIF